MQLLGGRFWGFIDVNFVSQIIFCPQLLHDTVFLLLLSTVEFVSFAPFSKHGNTKIPNFSLTTSDSSRI